MIFIYIDSVKSWKTTSKNENTIPIQSITLFIIIHSEVIIFIFSHSKTNRFPVIKLKIAYDVTTTTVDVGLDHSQDWSK